MERTRLSQKAADLFIHKRKTGSQQSEFALALFVFFVVIIIPLTNLMGVALSSGIICLLTHQIASRCSTQLTYPNALSAMTNECSDLAHTGFANFLNLHSAGGYLSCGSDLYIQSTPISSAVSSVVGPNSPLSMPPLKNNVYEYVAKTYFIVKPFIPMSRIPLVSQIPGLGQPVQIKWTAARAAEFVNGLADTPNPSAPPNIALPDLRTPNPPVSMLGPGVGPYGWRNPGIFQSLGSAVTILGETVLYVPANSTTYVNSNLDVSAPGANVYIDSHADGIWISSNDAVYFPLPTAMPPADANGYATFAGAPMHGMNQDDRAFGDYIGTTGQLDKDSTNPHGVTRLPKTALIYGTTSGVHLDAVPASEEPMQYRYNWCDLVGAVGNPVNWNVDIPASGAMYPWSAYFPRTVDSDPAVKLRRLARNSNTPAPGLGPLLMLNNDCWRQDNMGGQVVRAIIYIKS